MAEFTGERVIPGQVEPDLWNEHLARYAFAARLAAKCRVLDAGCGAGYGSAALARTAACVLGMDVSAEALLAARERYAGPSVRFLQGSCAALPLRDASVDLLVAFEVIEHIAEWRQFLAEARRVLAPGGHFVVSTPNKLYYAETRRLSGPNPYHVHEFDFDEFSSRLSELFPHVTLFVQNHAAGVAFHPASPPFADEASACLEDRATDPAGAHFFVAVCSAEAQPAPSSFIYLPRAANVLREREQHIEQLDAEIATKTAWLDELCAEKQKMVDMFRQQTAELERSNEWAAELNEKLRAAQQRIVQLQEELAQTIAGFQAQVGELEGENRKKTEWALKVQADLDAKGADLLNCIRLLDAAEQTVQERTAWALRLDAELKDLENTLNLIRASRWIKLGRAVGLGPVLEQG